MEISHIVLRFLFVFFSVFLVFGLRYIGGGRSSRHQLVFGSRTEHFRSFSETFRSNRKFRKFRKQNLSESSEGPHSEPICKQVSLWTTHEHLSLTLTWQSAPFRDFLSVLSSLFLQQETQLCKIPNYVSMIYSFH